MQTRLAAIVALALTGASASAVSVNLVSAAAPNGFGSASYATWFSNAQTAVRTGQTSVGTGFAAFNQLAGTNGTTNPRPLYEGAVTGFESWNGAVAPGSGEYGIRMHWVYSIKASAGESISLANISNLDVLETGWGVSGFSLFGGGGLGSNTFNGDTRVGYAADGTLVSAGSAEDWNAANAGNQISEIVGTFGMAYEPDPTWTGTPEQLLSQLLDALNGLAFWEGTLTYTDGNGSTTVNNTVIFAPLPGAAAMGFAGIAGLAGMRRRR